MKLILCLLSLLMFAPVVAEAQGTKNKRQPSVEEQLTSLVRQWDEAIVKRDTAMLDRLLASEFKFVGGRNKSEYLDSIKTQAADAVISAVSTDLEVLFYGSTAVVTGVDTISGQNKGQPYTAKWLYTDVWVKRAGRWQCVRTHASPYNR
jgi:ketosteroid isomerase-like protein